LGCRGPWLGAQRSGWTLDRIEAGAVVPQDLTALLVRQRQTEKLFDCLREGAVRMWVVARHYKIFRTQLIDDIYSRLLVDVERDIALALEVFARHRRNLPLATGPEFLPCLFSEKPGGSRTDAEIREQIVAEIDQQSWGPRGSIDVVVTNGVVVLKAAITDERERAALRVAAENVPGVKDVYDRLVWVASLSGIVIPRP